MDVGTCPHQVLVATLTLSQPGGVDYARPILVSTPSFESHRRTWTVTHKTFHILKMKVHFEKEPYFEMKAHSKTHFENENMFLD